MSRFKVLALIFAFLSFGAIQETYRIFTSDAPDIAAERSSLIPMAVIITSAFLGLTILFGIKSMRK